MFNGAKGQKRPADSIGTALIAAQIAAGERKEKLASGRVRSGNDYAVARAETLSSERRFKITAKAAEARRGQ